MYHIFPESIDNVIGIQVIDSLTTEDYETLLPFMDKLIQEHGTIRLLTDFTNLKQPDFWASVKVTPRALHYSKSVEKNAIITDEQWIKNIYTFSSYFLRTEIGVFPSSEREQAWEWIHR